MFKKLVFLFSFLLSFQVILAGDFPDQPNPPRLVNDYAGILSDQEQSYLEAKLEKYYDTTSTQIAVVIMPEVPGDYDYSDYAERLAEEWKIGTKGKDNGLLMFFAMKEHKVWFATGYGLEGALPDATVKIIIERLIIPDFKTKQYLSGIDQATNAVMQAAAGEFDANKLENKNGNSVLIVFIVIIIVFLISFFSNKGGGNKYNTINHRGSRGGTFYGGGWGGGRSSGGGSSFGGFGGGGFGGGGAGGSW